MRAASIPRVVHSGVPTTRDVGGLAPMERVVDSLQQAWSVRLENHSQRRQPFMRALLLRPPMGVLPNNSRQNNLNQLITPTHRDLTDQLAACETNYALIAHYDLFVLLLEDGAPVNATMFKLATTCNVIWQGHFDFNNWCTHQCDATKVKQFQDLGLLR